MVFSWPFSVTLIFPYLYSSPVEISFTPSSSVVVPALKEFNEQLSSYILTPFRADKLPGYPPTLLVDVDV